MSALMKAIEGSRDRTGERHEVVDADSGEVLEWQPALMVIPVSVPLRGYFNEGDWPARALVAAESRNTRLLPNPRD